MDGRRSADCGLGASLRSIALPHPFPARRGTTSGSPESIGWLSARQSTTMRYPATAPRESSRTTSHSESIRNQGPPFRPQVVDEHPSPAISRCRPPDRGVRPPARACSPSSSRRSISESTMRRRVGQSWPASAERLLQAFASNARRCVRSAAVLGTTKSRPGQAVERDWRAQDHRESPDETSSRGHARVSGQLTIRIAVRLVAAPAPCPTTTRST